jgi:hypothetical protein
MRNVNVPPPICEDDMARKRNTLTHPKESEYDPRESIQSLLMTLRGVSPSGPVSMAMRLSENAHLLRYPRPSSLRRTSMYTSFLGISEALQLDIFHQPLRRLFFDSFYRRGQGLGVFEIRVCFFKHLRKGALCVRI